MSDHERGALKSTGHAPAAGERVSTEGQGRGLHLPSPRLRPRRIYSPGCESMEARQLMAASLAPIANVDIPKAMGLVLPLEGGSGDNQTFTVTSTNPKIQASIPTGQFMTITVNHTSSGEGDPQITNEQMTFKLTQDLTPLTIQRISQLVTDGFYTNKTFHRIASGFPTQNDYIVQGGSVNGAGSGEVPLPGYPFEDEFVSQLAFTGKGQLAMANAGRDTNSSQFFITTGSPRSLDYIHTIFGELVSGQSTLEKLTRVQVNGTTPSPNPVTITSVTLADNNPDSAVIINTTDANIGETADISVTAKSLTDNTTITKTFTASVIANTENERPFFTTVPNNVSVSKNQDAVFQTRIFNAEAADIITYQVQGGRSGGTDNPTFTPVQNATATIDQNGVVRVTPNKDFVGTINLLVAVRDQVDRFGTGNRNFDTQALTITVTNSTTAVNLQPIAAAVTTATNVASPVVVTLKGDPANTGQTLIYSIAGQPQNGTLSSLDDKNGVITYTPNAGFVGTDTFRYTVRDVGDPTPNITSEAATVTINVSGQTSSVRLVPPVADGDAANLKRVLVVTPAPRKDRLFKNVINVTEDADGLVKVSVNGVTDATVADSANLTRIVIYGSKANDEITVDPSVTVPATLDGGQGGRNTLNAGSVGTRLHGWYGQTVMTGGDAKDALVGSEKSASFRISPGNDVYVKVSPNRGKPPKGQFFASNGRTLTPLPTPRPRIAGWRSDGNVGQTDFFGR